MKDITIALANGSIPRKAYPTMRLHRVGDTIDIYVNGVKVVIIDMEEWELITKAVQS